MIVLGEPGCVHSGRYRHDHAIASWSVGTTSGWTTSRPSGRPPEPSQGPVGRPTVTWLSAAEPEDAVVARAVIVTPVVLLRVIPVGDEILRGAPKSADVDQPETGADQVAGAG